MFQFFWCKTKIYPTNVGDKHLLFLATRHLKNLMKGKTAVTRS